MFKNSKRLSCRPCRKLTARIVVFSAVLWGGTIDAGESSPNVVLIMTDDQGIGDFGVTGNPVFRTPRIDALARQGASLSTFYVSPVCSPTRACLLTGRYNYRTRCIDTYQGRSMLDPDEVTLAEWLGGAGYLTGVFGKWHLGDCYPMRPSDQGFVESLVHRGGGLAQASDPIENERRYTNPWLWHNNQLTATEGYCTDLYFRAGLEFISTAVQKKQPFLAYFATNAPHAPLHDVPEALYQEYRRRTDELRQLIVQPGADVEQEIDRLARIGAMITNIDKNVGDLLDHLDRLGVADETIVVFLIDNGPATRRFVGNLRGQKSEVFEGGIRSPCWIRWPQRLKAGTSRAEPTAHIDLTPTLVDACGVSIPADAGWDGVSLLPILTDAQAVLPERPIVIQTHRGNRPVRYHHCMIRQGRWKLLNASGFEEPAATVQPAWQLYDLQADPAETNNLATVHPEQVARLQAAYDQWFDDVSSTRPDNYAPPKIRLGTSHENPTLLTRQDWRISDDGQIGRWEVAWQAGTYDIDVILQKPVEEGAQVRLVIGASEHVATMAAGERRSRLLGIRCGENADPLHAMVVLPDQTIPAYQLLVKRHDR